MNRFFWIWTLFVVLIAVSAVFAAINFGLSSTFLTGGSPAIVDGKIVLNARGSVLEITQERYHLLKLMHLRAFSGHWILFSVVPMGYFYGRSDRP